jgi:pyruvate dehydrogenase E2 component (dihydrolipoamide acetyltransferase)
VHASPSVRAFARELGVDLGQVKASGPKGRILKADVTAFVKGAMSTGVVPGKTVAAAAVGSLGGGLDLLPWPKVDFAKFGEIDVKPLSRIKKISGQNLARNWAMIPAVTYHEDADITDLEAFRVQMNKEFEKSGKKLTMLAFIIKASVRALQEFPEFNTSLDGDNLVYKKYFNIAFAADTPNGLVVPVIKDADKKSVFEIAAESGALAKQARDGKLKPGRHVGGVLHHQLARRHRRHLLRAHRQCARSGHPRGEQVGDEAGVGRQGVRAAPHPAHVADRGPPRDRRRAGHPLQRVPRPTAGGLPPGDALTR